ncbi:hypothetical protein ACP70R_048123 [Stipagrostis hirtigluma subsp. patula]
MERRFVLLAMVLLLSILSPTVHGLDHLAGGRKDRIGIYDSTTNAAGIGERHTSLSRRWSLTVRKGGHGHGHGRGRGKGKGRGHGTPETPAALYPRTTVAGGHHGRGGAATNLSRPSTTAICALLAAAVLLFHL